MNNIRVPDERHFLTSDNTVLFYRHWPAPAPCMTPKVIVLFHRGHEHSGRLQHIVDELAMPDTVFYARMHVVTGTRRVSVVIAPRWRARCRMLKNLYVSPQQTAVPQWKMWSS